MPAVRKKRAVGSKEAARGRILAAAIHLFHHRGIENVTFGEVAKRARLSRPLVYFYFPDLHSLLLEAVLLALQKLHTRFLAAAATGRNGLEATQAIGRAYLAFHAEEPELFFLCMAVGPSRRGTGKPSALERLLETEERAVMAVLVGCVERGMKDRSVRADLESPLAVSLCLWALSHGLAQCSSSQREVIEADYGVSPTAFLETGLGLLTRALARRP